MNAEQLHNTLRASQYAEQVLGKHTSALLEQDYAIDQFLLPLTTIQIQNIVHDTLEQITDESLMDACHSCASCALDVPLDLAGRQQG